MGRGRQEMGKGNERVRTCMSCLRLTCEVSSVPVYRNLDQTNFTMVSSVPVYRKLDQTNFIRRFQRSFVQDTWSNKLYNGFQRSCVKETWPNKLNVPVYTKHDIVHRRCSAAKNTLNTIRFVFESIFFGGTQKMW